MAAIETCLKKASGGELADFSEQQIIDCGYKSFGANGCNGAGPGSYIKYVVNSSLELTHESNYPYLGNKATYTCPNSTVAKPYKTGAKGRFKIHF